MFKVTVEDSGEFVVLRCHGSLVHGDETSLLCTAVHHHDRNLILDLSAVLTIDAAGIGALISLQTAGVYLRLESPTKPVREVLRVTGMESVFEICDLATPIAAFAENGSEGATVTVAAR